MVDHVMLIGEIKKGATDINYATLRATKPIASHKRHSCAVRRITCPCDLLAKEFGGFKSSS